MNVVTKLNISDAIWKSRGELEIEIKQKDENIKNLLNAFFTAYQKWYDFSYDENGKVKEIQGGETEQYMELMSGSDQTRKNLLSELE